MTPATLAPLLIVIGAIGLIVVALDVLRYRRAGRDWRPDARRDDGGEI